MAINDVRLKYVFWNSPFTNLFTSNILIVCDIFEYIQKKIDVCIKVKDNNIYYGLLGYHLFLLCLINGATATQIVI